MRQQAFRDRGEARWQRTELLVRALERRDRRGAEAFPALYRELCADLAVARDRMFDAPLVERLNRLALRAHQQLYRARSLTWNEVAWWVGVGFPDTVRRHAGLLAVAFALFVGSIVATAWSVSASPALVLSVLGADGVASIERMYDPGSEAYLRPIDSSSRFEMFGFYIANNVGIGFRIFAGGVLLGVGSLLILLYNGVLLGAVAAHLAHRGFSATFFPFVSGHSALELGAFVLLSVSGLRLGWSMVSPGDTGRGDALRRAARECVALVPGGAAMLVAAALVEAFWSPLPLPPAVKYAAGAASAAALVSYLALFGRQRGLRADQRRDP